MIIAVDFDDTLVWYDREGECHPNQLLLSALKRLRKRGHKLILWTCRTGKSLEEAVSWCKTKYLYFDAINENVENVSKDVPRKVIADIYIDDRAVSLERFEFLIKMNDRLKIGHRESHGKSKNTKN